MWRLTEVQRLNKRIVAGLMSGTSMDGIDVCLCEIQTHPWQCRWLAGRTIPYPESLRFSLLQSPVTLAQIAQWHRQIGEAFADALAQVLMDFPTELHLIGSHGQTVYHAHQRMTLQLGEAAFLAARFGCPVVSDFRIHDVAVGGCGAPLVPYVDARLFAQVKHPLLALNLGGIANFTLVVDGQAITAFDCGPANMVLDELAALFTRGKVRVDWNGDWARQGQVRSEWLDYLMGHPFITQPPPKSAGREQFGPVFVQELINHTNPGSPQSWYDLFATVTHFTAAVVFYHYQTWIRPHHEIGELVVSGGGVHNPVLMQELKQLFAPIPVYSSARYGIDPDSKEALAFAILASERIDGRSTNIPAVTGAKRPVLLGKITEL
ncbi:MAG: anhydro-N-acetylmuramic acid kinase [Gloeomargarita sp. SKYBB_i_bin120]|nr:anhydro-N-acetylmuramic acid kinase [Gloeomargarita sp. SKYB120]MDW8178723.1 anhydro-N-acetylmuramic acid kinase [Gloeomargarita sp. SKYBB_i_bin120]